MNDLLLRLRDKGNTVLVVEHKPEMITIARRLCISADALLRLARCLPNL
jgi:excinuclease UvrABC ATPase subunit